MKTALITGGSRGIGAACVRAFRQAGWQTAFFYRQSREAAEALARETGAIAVPCDVADSEAVRRAVQEAKAFLPHVDALVNNAGIASQELLTDVTDEQWRRMVDTNLSGAFYLCRAVLPGMISRREGSIVNVSSIWGRIGASCEVPYSAVKAGLIGLTRGLAKEVGPSGVRVNCVCPGVIRTDIAQHLHPGRSGRAGRRDPFGPSGHPGGRGPSRTVAFRPGVRLYHRAGAGRGRRLSRMKK